MRAPIYKRDDSPYYWTWIYTKNGKRKRISTRHTDRKAAQDAANRLQREVEKSSSAPAITVAQALLAYTESHIEWADRTKNRNATICFNLAQDLGNIPVSELTRNHIVGFVTQRQKTHESSTIAQELMRLYAALKLANLNGYAINVESLKVKIKVPPPSKDRWLTPDEVMRLCAVLPEDNGHWIWFACYTGCRTDEISRFTWDHIDFERSLLQVTGTKNKRGRRKIPIAEPLKRLLADRKLAGKPPIPAWRGKWQKLQAACKRAEIKPCSPHDFRRTFASWLLQKGVGHHAIADLLGQSGMQLVRSVYAHLGDLDLRAAIDKLT